MPMTTTDWRARAAALPRDARPFIDGMRVEPLGQATFDEHHPHDGSLVATLPDCGEADVDAAVASARRAFESGAWSGLAPSQRAETLRGFARLVERHHEALALLDSLEMGMPAALGVPDLQTAAAQMQETAQLAQCLADELLPSAPTTQALALRMPQGVVAAITPWNFPVYVALGKIVPALVMGNSLVLKPSELASLGCLRLGELAAEAGVPPGVFNVVTGRGPTCGRALALHADVDCLSFTGSTATGGQLMACAGQSNLKALLLECGGKSPQIVFDDLGDLDAVADALVDGFTWNSGQLCIAGTRILVARPLYERLWEAVASRVRALSTGDPLDAQTTLGPLASRAQAERVGGWLERARRDGLQAVAGIAAAGACHVAPTVLRDVPSSHPLMQEEIFGPVACVAPFDDEADALRLANDSRYGLYATIWTRDAAQAQRMARRVRAGSVVTHAVARPLAGFISGAGAEPVGMSGFGAEGGVEGLRAYTRLRSVTHCFG